MTIIAATYEEHKETLIDVINDLARYFYMANFQAKYWKIIKETFGKTEAIFTGDFAKDYQFLIQDKIQSYHWGKEYCKWHPLVVHYLGPDGRWFTFYFWWQQPWYKRFVSSSKNTCWLS